MQGAEAQELALIARCNRGEEAAFEEIHRLHAGWLLGLARRLTRDEAEAQDLVQESFLELWRRFPGFELSASLRAFLYPVVRHRAIDLARRRRRLEPSEDAPEPGLTWVPPDPALRDRVDGLPEAQREVVLLRFGLDFRLEEIAEAQSVPLGTVKSRLHHALRSLRSQLQPSDP